MSQVRYRPMHAALLMALVGTLALALSSARGQADSSLIANGSFELGDNSPAGWTLTGAGARVEDSAKRGARFVRVEPGSTAGQWLSDPIQLSLGTDYRLEAWVRVPKGTARV